MEEETINSGLLYVGPVIVIDNHLLYSSKAYNLGIAFSRDSETERLVLVSARGYIYLMEPEVIATSPTGDQFIVLKVVSADGELLHGFMGRAADVETEKDMRRFVKWISDAIAKFISINVEIDDDIVGQFAYSLVDSIHIVACLIGSFPTDLYDNTMKYIVSEPTLAVLEDSRTDITDKNKKGIPKLPACVRYRHADGDGYCEVCGTDHDSVMCIRKIICIS